MTCSIVARDPESGEMGIATQSQALAVGSSVPILEPGVGVIATQSMALPACATLANMMATAEVWWAMDEAYRSSTGPLALRLVDPTVEPDLLMWRSVVLALAGETDDARRIVGRLREHAPAFVETLRRFGPAGLLPDDSVLDRMLA